MTWMGLWWYVEAIYDYSVSDIVFIYLFLVWEDR